MSTLTSTASVNETGFKAFVKRNPLISMYVVMFMIAWPVMVPQALYSQGIISAPLPLLLEILTGWAPVIAAIAVAAVSAGRAGIAELLGRFRIWRVGAQWYRVA